MNEAKGALAPLREPMFPPSGTPGRSAALFLMVLGPLCVALTALFLGQDVNWDLRNYHWYNAYAFLNDRNGFDLLPSQTPWFYNPLIDVPFYLLAQNFGAIQASFVLGLVQGLNFPLLFILAHGTLSIPNQKRKVWACAALASLGLCGGGGIAQIGTTFYDNVTSLGLFTSLALGLLFLKSLFDGPLKKALVLSVIIGIPSGFAMGLKLPSVVFCVGLCGAFFFVKGSFSRRFSLAFACGCGVLLGLFASFGFWAEHLFSTYGNPIFPYFNDVFASPYAPRTSARDTQFLPKNAFDFLFFPFLFAKNPLRVGEIPWTDFRLPVLYALWPVALVLRMLFGRNKRARDIAFKPLAARFVLGFGALSYGAWLLLFAIYRYVIPLEMLAPLALVFVVGMLPVKASSRALTTVFVLVFIALTLDPGTWGRGATWHDSMVEVDVPAFDLSQESPPMILMTGYEPYAHVVPSFPEEIPFVRVQSNFTSMEKETAFRRVFKEKIDAHKGAFFLLIPDWQAHAEAGKALSSLGLAVSGKACLPVRDRPYDSKLVLCSLTRVKDAPL